VTRSERPLLPLISTRFGSWAAFRRETGNGSRQRSPLDVYPTNDGHVVINVAVEEHWHHLLAAMDREDLRDDPRFRTNADRVGHMDDTYALIAAWTRLGKDEGVRDRQTAPHPLCPGPRLRRGHARPAYARAWYAQADRARQDRPYHCPDVAIAVSWDGQGNDRSQSEARPAQRRRLWRLARPVVERDRRSQAERV